MQRTSTTGSARDQITCRKDTLRCRKSALILAAELVHPIGMDNRPLTTVVATLNARVNAEAFFYYPRLQALAQYVRTHVGEHLTLEKVAKRVGLEKKYFSAFFRSKVGITWTEWLRLLRVLYATEKIRLREQSITRIAVGVGFRDLRTFERAFKRYVGVPPKVYQTSVRPRPRPAPP